MPNTIAKPFIKWVGGKRQLMNEINDRTPNLDGRTYVEPFLGGGSVLLNMLQHHKVSDAIVNDFNKDLIATYVKVRDNVKDLVTELEDLQKEYLGLPSLEAKKEFYLTKRELFNIVKHDALLTDQVPALFIFLNKTGFNGLYRLNLKGNYNAHFGNHENPPIVDESNLNNVSNLISNVTFKTGSYELLEPYIPGDSFIYCDPPYRPLNSMASFTRYTQSAFNDDTQTHLSGWLKTLHETKGIQVMLSNSDPKNTDPTDNFFDDLYSWGKIERVSASRKINRDANGRGKVNEILFTAL